MVTKVDMKPCKDATKPKRKTKPKQKAYVKMTYQFKIDDFDDFMNPDNETDVGGFEEEIVNGVKWTEERMAAYMKAVACELFGGVYSYDCSPIRAMIGEWDMLDSDPVVEISQTPFK